MVYLVYRVDLELQLRYSEGTLIQHTNMNQWLKAYGDRKYIYEVWKPNGLHSRWMWKIKIKRWGRLSSPRN